MQNWFLLFLMILALYCAVGVASPTGVNSSWLISAARSGDVKLTRFWLAMGAIPNFKTTLGRSAIVAALPAYNSSAKQDERKEIIKLLVSKGATLTKLDSTGQAPIHYAVGRGLNGFIKFLCQLGADINQPTKRGLSPLFIAIRDRKADMLGEVVSAGASLSSQNSKGQTALHYAIERKSKLIPLLLKMKAPLDIKDAQGLTPVTYALRRGNRQAVSELFKANLDLRTKDELGWTPFHFACEGDENIAQRFVSLNFPLSEKTNNGLTPLHIACAKTKTSLARQLIENGVPLASQDSMGRTPLWYALCSQNLVTAKLLVKKGTPVNTVDKDKRTILHNVAASGSDELASFISTLLEAGADINAQDKDGRTPLHLAASSLIDFGLKELLVFGASTDVKDNKGKTAAQLAVGPTKRRKLAEAALTVSWRGTAKAKSIEDKLLGPPLYAAVRSGDDFLMERLLKKRFKVDEQNRIGRTALHYAAELGQTKMVNLLLRAKASKIVKDKEGKTPYDVAKEKGYSVLARSLVFAVEKR